MVGIVLTQVVWKQILMSVFADAVTGVDIVVQSSSGEGYTYRVEYGEAYLTGEGDHHDTKFDSFAVDIELTLPSLFAPTSSYYTLTLYPGQDLYHVYSTRNPLYAALGAVCIIAFTSIMFFCFDFHVRRASKAQLSLLEAKRKFVRFVSHEVRTPLNSVCMGLTLLKHEISSLLRQHGHSSSSNLGAKLEKRLEQSCRSWLALSDEVAANATCAVDVLNDFLNYDKVESGQLSLDYAVVPIFELIEETVVEFKLPAAKKKIIVCVCTPLSSKTIGTNSAGDTESAEQFVVGDKVRLTQVFRNLISNAIKFTPDGGSITVEAEWIPPSQSTADIKPPKTFTIQNQEILTCYQSWGSVVLSVHDSGVGMTTMQVEAVFQQGTQFNVNELQAGNGSGLGTYIAKGIVQQHGGKMSAFSGGLQKGSTFSMSLPLYELPTELLARHHKRKRVEQTKAELEQPMGSLRILVVDDAHMNLKLMRRLLEKQGHTTEGAENGQVAVTMVQEAIERYDPFDVILTDYQMPVMDGPTAAQEMRRLGCDSFIVGVTGNLMPEDIRHFKSMGANAVLPKPIKLPDLEAVLMEYDIRATNEQERRDETAASMRYQMSFSQLGVSLPLGELPVCNPATTNKNINNNDDEDEVSISILSAEEGA